MENGFTSVLYIKKSLASEFISEDCFRVNVKKKHKDGFTTDSEESVSFGR